MRSGRRVNVRAVIVRDNKILAVKHKSADGSEKEYWAIPGGGLDPMESLQDGVRREIKEELGVDVDAVGRLLFIQQYKTERDDFEEELELFFLVEGGDMYDDIDLAKSSHGFDEISRVEFIDPKEAFILPRFFSEIDVIAYAKQEQAPYIFNALNEEGI